MATSILSRLLAGSESRKTRLHDEKRNLVGAGRLVAHAPLALVTGCLRLAIGYRPELPWISYSAIAVLKANLTKSSRVLEFGSGMSTIWYAKRAGNVYSVEDYKPWFDKVNEIIKRRGLRNIHYQFANAAPRYSSFMANDQTGFDLVMVDGSHRSACIDNAARLIRPGGILYLDNSDKDSGSGGGDMRLAEELALRLASETGARVTYFTDFAPTQLFVQQGLMVELPGPSRKRHGG